MHLPQFGQYQVQIFISLTLVMGGLFVALICDYLKGTNEQLREQNVALRIQRAQERKRTLTARSRSARMVALQQPAVNEAVAAPADSLAPSLIAPSLRSGAKTEMAMVAAPTHPEAAQTVAVATGRVRPSRSNGASRRPISADALAAMERGAARAAAKRPAASIAEVTAAEVTAAEVSANVAEEIALPLGVTTAAKMENVEKIKATSEAQAEAAVAPSQVILGNKRNWSDILSHRSQNNAPIFISQPPIHMPQPATNAQGGDVPAGFYDGYVLTRLVQSHKPVSGLVVSIGVSAAHENGEANLAAVRSMIQAMMGPQDFAAASAPGEYLLIFPQERGAAAQRRLSAIAQQLWDFQLRTPAHASILFSWGGVEARGELIEDAIASASERMQETRRTRMARSFDARSYKMAV